MTVSWGSSSPRRRLTPGAAWSFALRQRWTAHRSGSAHGPAPVQSFHQGRRSSSVAVRPRPWWMFSSPSLRSSCTAASANGDEPSTRLALEALSRVHHKIAVGSASREAAPGSLGSVLLPAALTFGSCPAVIEAPPLSGRVATSQNGARNRTH